MKIAIGCDKNGYGLKETIKKYLESNYDGIVDYGCDENEDIDYPEIAFKMAKDVSEGKFSRGILICGTGIGMAIAAGKVPGIRAAVCHDIYSAERARRSNNAQIMAMGALIVGPELAKKLVGVWMDSEFDGGNSGRKVDKIMATEKVILEGKFLDVATAK